ncbi:uncharacterized protein [Watersipora subatra]|uniref:uncharacterized protein n=1 Tax=Watersipora subatra TaxID=2589382 RepID=UPI00355B97C2
MYRPWTQFATNYAEKGNDKGPYPNSPVSQPTYNRSPAPFSSMSFQQTPACSQNFDTNQNHLMQQAPYECTEKQHFYHAEQQKQVYNEQPQHQQLGQPSPAAVYHQPLDSNNNQVKNVREDPDMDENFPSYNDIRKVFVDKQKEERESVPNNQMHPRPARNVLRRPPSPQVSKKPPMSFKKPVGTPFFSPQSRADSTHNSQPTHTVNVRSSTQKPTHQMSKVSHDPSQEQKTEPQRIRHNSMRVPSRQLSASPYQEVAVRNVNNESSTSWQHIKPSRDAVKSRPPLPLHIPTMVESPTKVIITSNSPHSPQKATYIPDGNYQPAYQTSSQPLTCDNSLSMNSVDNQPRRRRSYAEVMITHNSLPRNFTSRPTLSKQHSSDGHVTNGSEEMLFSRERRCTTLNRRSSYSSKSNSVWTRADSAPVCSQRTARIEMRSPSMNQMLYPSSPASSQQPSPFYAGHAGSPQVVSASSQSQAGKSAAHLQFNSPMALYSTANAQEALAKDKEASELIQIVGPGGKVSTIQTSPTLKAVLREDQIKRQTGYKPNVGFYHCYGEYGPGYGPLRQYEEVPDTLSQTITFYNEHQDKSLTYPVWNTC